jgi:PAS domain S-box-containing protein
MTAETNFNQKFLRGSRGRFFQKEPPGIIMLFLLLLWLPMVLFSLSGVDRQVTELEKKLKTAGDKEKIRLLMEFAINNRETAPGKSLAYAREALRLAEKAGGPEEIFTARHTLGTCYHANSQSRMAVRYYLEALKLEPHINNKNLIADVLSNIGIVYWRLDDNVMAEKFHLQALEIRKKHGAPKASMALTLNNLGLTAREKGDIAGALQYYREALNLYAGINHKPGLATTLNNIAIIHKDHTKDYSKALEYFQKTLSIYEEIKHQQGLASANYNIGRTYTGMRQYKTARTYLETALKLAKEINAKYLIYNIYTALFNMYGRKQDFKQALEYHKLYVQLKDVIFDEESSQKIVQLQARYEAETKENEIRWLHKKNEAELLVRVFLATAAVLFLGMGLVLYRRFHIKRKANQLLRISETKYRALFSQADEAIFLANRGTFVDCNEKTMEMFGVTRDQVIGRTFIDFSPSTQPDKQESFEAGMERIERALKGEPQHFYWQHIKKDGTPIDTMVSLAAVTINRQLLIQVIVHDISQRKRLEEERINSAKFETISLLAGGIAHDFNNLLTAILWNLEMIKAELQPQERRYSLLSKAENAVNSAAALAKQFHTIAKKEFYFKEIVSIERILREAIVGVLEEADARTRCYIDIPKDLLTIKGDTRQIKRVMRHLTRNALDAMRPGGKIEVSAVNLEVEQDEVPPLQPGHYVVISMKDNGEGIPKENLVKIFDPYFSTRGHVTRKGLGMGLAIAQAIIKGHNGTITVSSQIGTGTTFNIYLPTIRSQGGLFLEKTAPV